jgi:hypothetical protein
MNTIAGIFLFVVGMLLLVYVFYMNRLRKRLERHLNWLTQEGERLDKIFNFVKIYQKNLTEVFESLKKSNTERYEFYCEKLTEYTVTLEAEIKKLEKERSDNPPPPSKN